MMTLDAHDNFAVSSNLDTLIHIMINAGTMARDMYDKNEYTVYTKGDKSPVTEADKKVEIYIEEQLTTIAPNIPIIGEEGMSHAKDNGSDTIDVSDVSRYWLVDPIDGTREFIDRTGQYAVCIALIENGIPEFGMIYAPSYNDCIYVGGCDMGAWRQDVYGNRTPLPLPDEKKDEVRIITSGRNFDADKAHKFLKTKTPLCHKRMGSALKFCMLAENQAHFYPRFAPTMEWDTAAGDAILRQIGGGIVTMDNKPLTYGKSDFKNPHFVAYGPEKNTDFLKL